MLWAELQRGKNLYISECRLLLAMPKEMTSAFNTQRRKKIETPRVSAKKFKRMLISFKPVV